MLGSIILSIAAIEEEFQPLRGVPGRVWVIELDDVLRGGADGQDLGARGATPR